MGLICCKNFGDQLAYRMYKRDWVVVSMVIVAVFFGNQTVRASFKTWKLWVFACHSVSNTAMTSSLMMLQATCRKQPAKPSGMGALSAGSALMTLKISSSVKCSPRTCRSSRGLSNISKLIEYARFTKQPRTSSKN
jgi:hypothetical protein